MLTLEKIKELAKYTDSPKVLKVALELSDENIKYVTNLYNTLSEKELYIPKEYTDVIVENYIRQRLIENKVSIEKLINLDEFRKKIASLTREELAKFMELCNKDASNDLIINKTIISNYSARDHFKIIEMGDKIRTKKTEVKDIFFAALKNKCPVNSIMLFINSVEKILTPVNTDEVTRLFNSKDFYLYPCEKMIEIIDEISAIQDKRTLKLLVNIAIAGYWVDIFTFKQVANLALTTTIKNQVLLEKEVTYNRSYEDIVEMLDITKNSTHLVTLFINEIICRYLSYEQIINLINNYDLNNIENYDKFAIVLSKIIQKGTIDNLYDKLCMELNKDAYEETVIDYLETCDSINEFIKVLENNYKDTDPIDPNAMLSLKNF